jgi:hypothetical protein
MRTNFRMFDDSLLIDRATSPVARFHPGDIMTYGPTVNDEPKATTPADETKKRQEAEAEISDALKRIEDYKEHFGLRYLWRFITIARGPTLAGLGGLIVAIVGGSFAAGSFYQKHFSETPVQSAVKLAEPLSLILPGTVRKACEWTDDETVRALDTYLRSDARSGGARVITVEPPPFTTDTRQFMLHVTSPYAADLLAFGFLIKKQWPPQQRVGLQVTSEQGGVAIQVPPSSEGDRLLLIVRVPTSPSTPKESDKLLSLRSK